MLLYLSTELQALKYENVKFHFRHMEVLSNGVT